MNHCSHNQLPADLHMDLTFFHCSELPWCRPPSPVFVGGFVSVVKPQTGSAQSWGSRKGSRNPLGVQGW